MAFKSLLNNIKNVIDGNLPFGIGAKGGNARYPEKVNGQPINKYTNIAGTETEWKESLGYSFQVVKVIGGFLDVEGSREWKEFRLQINPQELTQDEIFAIEVTPTLRGVMVEHHGVTLKDITISGTTGISPNRKEAGTNRDGSPIFMPGTSGYKEFHELRSYFRLYVEAKRTDTDGTLRMIFKNYKDKEYLYVEPIKFTMKRSANKPMMYDYTIVLKAIGVANDWSGPRDWSTAFDIAESLDKYLDYANEAVRVINGAFGIINRFQRDINSVLLAPLNAITQAVNAVRGGLAQTLTQANVTRKAIDDLKNVARKINLQFNDAVNSAATAQFNAITGRTATLKGNPNRQPTYDELAISNALNDIDKALTILAGLNDDMFETDVFQQNSQTADVYGEDVRIVEPSAVESIDILATDDLQTIASRVFNDPDKFRDIAILNNLKAPYISEAGGEGVLKPGDKILIPKYSGSGSTGVIGNKEYNITKKMTQAEKAMGVDLRINDEGDFIVSNTKDLSLVAGMDNMAQAAALKLSYEKRSLKRHVGIGADLNIGSKGPRELSEVREQIVSSFLSDNRVESVPYIDLRREGGTILLNILLKLKSVDQPIPIPLKLNN
jgi:hypothetical protein